MGVLEILLIFVAVATWAAAGEIPTHHRIVRSVIPVASTKLFDEEECRDLKSFCGHLKMPPNDLEVLECIHTLRPSQLEDIPENCQHIIWNHTKKLLQDDSIKNYTRHDCSRMTQVQECENSVQNQLGSYLSCLIEKIGDSSDAGICRMIIQRLESVAFTDYHFIGNFLQDCEEEIENQRCGRLNTEQEKISQGETLACLQDRIESLGATCKKRILKIAQQQAENLKLDRQFFLACENDLTFFCSQVFAPTNPGAAFKCLLKKRNSPEMSSKCRSQITRRDKLLAHDYQISRGLAKACKKDIQNNHCRKGVSEDKSVRLAQILLCLESVTKNGTKISEDCQVEINDHRKMLMIDYKLSPEILSGCGDDIQNYCENAGTEVIRCLMNHARTKKRKERVTSVCLRALEGLIKVSDAGEDWRVDPVLRRSCKPVVDAVCSDADGGEARVMSCLMEHIGSQQMTADCEKSLMLIQYFVARNFKLDPQLYKQCKEDAVRYCKAKKTWDDVATSQFDPERAPIIFPCLHRMAYSTGEKKNPLKKECVKEIKRVMRQRAISVDLIPEVEDYCLDDLAKLCFDKTGKGAEMQCLQDNLEKLEDKCKEAVTSFTEDEAGHVELNPVIMMVCQDAMKNHCNDILQGNSDEENMMDCLISHKNDADLRQDLKCRAAIEHFQIISLKNYHFTYKFKEACRPYVVRYCGSSTTKNDVVACLSEVMRNDTIRGQRHAIPKECRQQVKAQLYQQRESLALDPQLANNCRDEISKFCNDKTEPGQVNKNALECLQTHTQRLGELCRHSIFMIKKSELGDSATDYTLVNTCKEMTFRYCQNTETSKLLDCLKVYKDEKTFDPRCHLVVVNRLIEQNTDYRFNPALQLACGNNINQYCSSIVATAKVNEELNGKVISCLKIKFREAKLDEKCEQKMIEILKEQALNYKLNPLLQSFCKSEIDILCKKDIQEDIEDNGIVEECLKTAFLNGKIVAQECKIEVATLISEAKADIHVDPLLQRACTVDLLKYCSNVRSGNGRQLKCLQKILQEESTAMEDDCRKKLKRRMEMFRNAETALGQPPENMGELVNQVIASPANKFFLVIGLTFFGFIFIIGMFMGRITKRERATKLK